MCDYFFPRAVLFTSSLMHQATAARPKVTVIYATETGKSETLANNLCSLFNCAFSTRVRAPSRPRSLAAFTSSPASLLLL